MDPNPNLRPDLERVLRPGRRVCAFCCGPTTGAYALCFACRAVSARLHQALVPVLPVSLCPLPGPLYRVLMGYKESPIDEVRRRHQLMVHVLFSDFFGRHSNCVTQLLGGPANLVLPVPSSARPGKAPLDRVSGLGDHVTELLEHGPGAPTTLWCPTVLERTGEPIGHMQADPAAFAVPDWARPMVAQARVLLLDDTYVSGARAQSAAAALRLAGATRALIVPLGRVIRPDTLPEHADFLRRSRVSRAAPYRCARCVVTQREAAGWRE